MDGLLRAAQKGNSPAPSAGSSTSYSSEWQGPASGKTFSLCVQKALSSSESQKQLLESPVLHFCIRGRHRAQCYRGLNQPFMMEVPDSPPVLKASRPCHPGINPPTSRVRKGKHFVRADLHGSSTTTVSNTAISSADENNKLIWPQETMFRREV